MSLATKVDFDYTAFSPPTGGVMAKQRNDGGTPTVKMGFGVDKMTGDTGSGGAPGVVPAPAAGDAAAGKFLKADGTWSDPTGGTGGHPDDEVPFTSSRGDFTWPHGLGYTPGMALISMTDLGIVVFQGGSPLLRWDGTNFYLRGSDAGLTGFVEVWR